MKIAVISDIHGNLTAFEAVLRRIDHERCDRIVCAGDIVGYGPRPRECVRIARERRIACVQGNHDAWVARGTNGARINDDTRQVLEWSRKILLDDAVGWLGSLPRQLVLGNITVTHASNAMFPEWPYILKPAQLLTSCLFQQHGITCHGHTHLPMLGVHQPGEAPRFTKLRDLSLNRTARYHINTGSVGQPRDGNWLSSFIILDTDDMRMRYLRVPYEVELTQKRIRHLGLPERFATRLAKGR